MRERVPAVQRSSARGVKVLLVDDNEVLLTALRGLLRLLGYSPDIARNGREALEATARRVYDVVLLDVQMPEMGGFEAARSLRRAVPSDGSPPRIIGISGEPTDRESYRAAGMDDFLSKPVRRGDLARVLDASLEARRHAARADSEASAWPCTAPGVPLGHETSP